MATVVIGVISFKHRKYVKISVKSLFAIAFVSLSQLRLSSFVKPST